MRAVRVSVGGGQRLWFLFFDEDGGGTLCKDEVTRALIKSFKLSSDLSKVREMREIVDNIWFVFDTDHSGEIDLSEFVADGGLADTIIASQLDHRR